MYDIYEWPEKFGCYRDAVREEGLLHRSDQLSFQEFIQFLIDTLRFAVTPIDQN